MTPLALVPQDLEAEGQILGPLLLGDEGQSGRIADTVAAIDADDLFFDVGNRAAFRAIRSLHSNGVPVNPISVAYELSQHVGPDGRSELDALGGQSRLHEYVAAATVGGLAFWIAPLRRCRQLRRHASRGAWLQRAAMSGDADPATITAAVADWANEPDASSCTAEPSFVWARDLAELPALDWLIGGVLPSGELAAIVGPYASAKSFLALDFSCCVATGLPWHGRAVQPGFVLYIVGEGLRGLHGRVTAWEEANGRTVEGVVFAPRAVQLLRPADVDALLSSIRRELPAMPALIVLDTLSRSMTGADENAQRDMSIAVDAADRLRRETGAACLLVHHEGKGGGYRGSSVLPGALETMIAVAKKGDVVTVSCDKQKNAPSFDAIDLVLRPYGPSLALESEPIDALIERHKAALTAEKLRALEALENGATFAEWQRASGSSATTFKRYREQLIAAGLVRCEGAKYYRNPSFSGEGPQGPQQAHGPTGPTATGGPTEGAPYVVGALTGPKPGPTRLDRNGMGPDHSEPGCHHCGDKLDAFDAEGRPVCAAHLEAVPA